MSKRSKSAGYRVGARVFIIRPPHNSKKMHAEENKYDTSGVITREGTSLNGGWFEVLLDGELDKFVYYRRGSMELVTEENARMEDPEERKRILDAIKLRVAERERLKAEAANSESDDSDSSDSSDDDSDSDADGDLHRGHKRSRDGLRVDVGDDENPIGSNKNSRWRPRNAIEDELTRIFPENSPSASDRGHIEESDESELDEEKCSPQDKKRRKFVQPAIPATPPTKPANNAFNASTPIHSTAGNSINSVPSPLFHPQLVSFLQDTESDEFEFDFDDLLSAGSMTDGTAGPSISNSNLSSPAIQPSEPRNSLRNLTSIDLDEGKVSARKKSRRFAAPQSTQEIAARDNSASMSEQLRGIFHGSNSNATSLTNSPSSAPANKVSSRSRALKRVVQSDSEEDYCCASCRVSSSAVWRLAELQSRTNLNGSTVQLLLCDSCSRNYLQYRINCTRCFYVCSGEDLNSIRCPQCRAQMPDRADQKTPKSARSRLVAAPSKPMGVPGHSQVPAPALLTQSHFLHPPQSFNHLY